ncbi:hypothetical protein FOCC_FOCC001974, partial [Frankliniella occidentalis]
MFYQCILFATELTTRTLPPPQLRDRRRHGAPGARPVQRRRHGRPGHVRLPGPRGGPRAGPQHPPRHHDGRGRAGERGALRQVPQGRGGPQRAPGRRRPRLRRRQRRGDVPGAHQVQEGAEPHRAEGCGAEAV